MSLFWFLLFPFCLCVPKELRVKAFSIDSSSSGSASVEILTRSNKVESCVFTFKTGTNQLPNTTPMVQSAQSTSRSSLELLTGFKNACVEATIGSYWGYHICLNGKILQSHAPYSFDLGQFTEVNEKELSFEFKKGLPCEALPKADPRESILKFACNPNAHELTLQNVVETSMCKYVITVVHASLCVSKDFPYVPIKAEPLQERPLDGHEDWFLQLSEAIDGTITCGVHSLEYLKRDTALLQFEFFSLKITRPIDSSLVVLRQYARNDLDSIEFIEQEKEIKSSDQFAGKISYVKITTNS